MAKLMEWIRIAFRTEHLSNRLSLTRTRRSVYSLSPRISLVDDSRIVSCLGGRNMQYTVRYLSGCVRLEAL